MKNVLTLAISTAALLGCATQNPVLYPNAKLKQVGEAASQRDVDECIALADKAGASGGTSAAGRGGIQGAAVGGAAAAVGSLIRGGNVITDAAAGAAVGAAAGAAGGAVSNSGSGNSTFRNFVGRCLAERGYDVIGWK